MLLGKYNRIVKQTIKIIRGRYKNIYYSEFRGATFISADNLGICYSFKTNEELKIAKANGHCKRISEDTKSILLDKGYPSVENIGIDFVSHEDVLLKCNGNYYLYLK